MAAAMRAGSTADRRDPGTLDRISEEMVPFAGSDEEKEQLSRFLLSLNRKPGRPGPAGDGQRVFEGYAAPPVMSRGNTRQVFRPGPRRRLSISSVGSGRSTTRCRHSRDARRERGAGRLSRYTCGRYEMSTTTDSPSRYHHCRLGLVPVPAAPDLSRAPAGDERHGRRPGDRRRAAFQGRAGACCGWLIGWPCCCRW